MSGVWNLMGKPNYHFWEIHYCGTRSSCAKKGHDLREVEELKLKLLRCRTIPWKKEAWSWKSMSQPLKVYFHKVWSIARSQPDKVIRVGSYKKHTSVVPLQALPGTWITLRRVNSRQEVWSLQTKGKTTA